tara:strand:+ start:2933 stop:3682 length:750 start_codon:yes stop_codon:yes gene_type:complete
MYLKKFFLSFLFLGTNSFTINRRQALGTFISMSSFEKKSKDEAPEVIKHVNPEIIPLEKQVFLNDDSMSSEFGIIQNINNEIYFYGPVSQRSCYELKNKLNELDLQSRTLHLQYKMEIPPIHLHIQSSGGSLYHTLYIVDLIDKLETPVYTYVDGFAASAATLISVVGKKRFMTKNSLMLIHQLSGGDAGKYYELQDQMTNMGVLMRIIGTVYLNHTKLNANHLNYLLQKDLWLDADTCLGFGLVDEII